MADKNTVKVYDKTRHKIRENWEDTRYLIALHLRLLERTEELNGKIDRLWQLVNNIYGD